MPPNPTISKGKSPNRKSNDNFHEFDASGQVQVRVKVNNGQDTGKTPSAGDDLDPPSSGNGFTLTRLVMNLKVPGGANNIEIHVRAAGANETKLAWHDGTSWHTIGAKTGNYIVASVDNWPADPAVGLGH